MKTTGWMLAAVVGVAAVLAGCHGGYSSWPPVGGNTADNNINGGSMPVVMATALRWTARRYPPVAEPEVGMEYDVAFAVNLPPGSSDATYENVVGWIGPLANPMTPQTESLPTYHVRRVEIRGPVAEVDVVRPVVGLTPGPDGQTVYQGVTVLVRGGQHPWKVESHRVFPLGMMDVPARTYKPESVRRPISTSPAPEPGAGARPEGEPEAPEPMPASEPMRPSGDGR